MRIKQKFLNMIVGIMGAMIEGWPRQNYLIHLR